ncbi:MAG: cyclic nucleotide-binding domain-containing protein [Betaproteobacteria bacterium]|nr:cyclic nucleotide-binding domain-containing protein [Betaproteobacteria bacterium]
MPNVAIWHPPLGLRWRRHGVCLRIGRHPRTAENLVFRLFSASKPSSLAQQLAAVGLFSTLSLRELKIVSALIHERQALAGEIVFDEGEEGQAIYIVFSGEIMICHQGKTESPIAMAGPGRIFGELALIDGGPRSAQARASTDCELGVMFRGDFDNLMESHATIAAKISFQLARHYAGIIRHLALGPAK